MVAVVLSELLEDSWIDLSLLGSGGVAVRTVEVDQRSFGIRIAWVGMLTSVIELSGLEDETAWACALSAFFSASTCFEFFFALSRSALRATFGVPMVLGSLPAVFSEVLQQIIVSLEIATSLLVGNLGGAELVSALQLTPVYEVALSSGEWIGIWFEVGVKLLQIRISINIAPGLFVSHWIVTGLNSLLFGTNLLPVLLGSGNVLLSEGRLQVWVSIKVALGFLVSEGVAHRSKKLLMLSFHLGGLNLTVNLSGSLKSRLDVVMLLKLALDVLEHLLVLLFLLIELVSRVNKCLLLKIVSIGISTILVPTIFLFIILCDYSGGVVVRARS